MKEFAISHQTSAATACEERHFLEALTRWNYFPNQKESATELPPSISTRRFTPEIAHALLKASPLSKTRKKLGFNYIEYRATRYNNVSRTLGIIHPLALSQIFQAHEANYHELKEAIHDNNSAISVASHLDGRMFIMNYENPETKALTATNQGFGKKFRAHTDISNCFGSIYTHSLEWAIQGFNEAKAKLAEGGHPHHWSAELDRVLRGAKRNETSGLPIGPASSSIAVEIILAAVDRQLKDKFSFVRYIDDYTAVCDTHAEAEEFIRLLGKELSQYRLSLNLAKTSIIELPSPLQEHWVGVLMSALPPLLRDDGQIAYMTTRDAFQFLDHAVRLNNETPDGSVIKFALSAICARVQGKAAADVLQYAINLCWHYPILLPYLEKIDARSDDYDRDDIIKKLESIITTNARDRRSDGMCWALYYLERLDSDPTDKSIEAIIESKDCIAISMLCNFESALERTSEYGKSLLGQQLYTIDENWLLLYQLYRLDKVENPYTNDKTFEILKKFEVDFFCPPGEESRAEQYCTVVSYNFDDCPPTFSEWMKV